MSYTLRMFLLLFEVIDIYGFKNVSLEEDILFEHICIVWGCPMNEVSLT